MFSNPNNQVKKLDGIYILFLLHAKKIETIRHYFDGNQEFKKSMSMNFP